MKIVAVLIALVATLALFGTAIAFHPWSVYHWTSDSLSPTVLDKTSSSLYDVGAGVAEWADLGTPLQPVLARKKGKITVSEASSVFWLGLAQVFIDDGHITKGRVKLNTSALISLGSLAADHVLCQELGHVLGLDHNRIELNTCMNDQAPLGSATSPNVHDAEQLTLNHDHEDASGNGKGNGNGKGGRGKPADGWITVHVFPLP